MATELKSCPLCGGYIRITERTENIVTIHTTAECMGCHMVFEHDQDFTFSKKARVQVNDSFETAWNRRTTVETNIFDKEEIYPDCTVQVLTNTVTGETSVGWWKNGKE